MPKSRKTGSPEVLGTVDGPADVIATLDPTDDSARRLFERRIEGPVVMLNLLRLRDWADYSAAPDLAPSEPISGHAAYDRYIEHTMPFLAATGGSMRFLGAGGHLFIGPEAERWDIVMLIEQASVDAFVEFAVDAGYLAGIGHRTAALEDSRLLPMVERQLP